MLTSKLYWTDQRLSEKPKTPGGKAPGPNNIPLKLLHHDGLKIRNRLHTQDVEDEDPPQ